MLSHLLELIITHAKSLLPLLTYLTSTKNDPESTASLQYRCSQPWLPFLQSLATTSPVCALVHTSEEVMSIFEKMQTEEYDVTRTPASMRLLQCHVPILFNLVKNLDSFPHVADPVGQS